MVSISNRNDGYSDDGDDGLVAVSTAAAVVLSQPSLSSPGLEDGDGDAVIVNTKRQKFVWH